MNRILIITLSVISLHLGMGLTLAGQPLQPMDVFDTEYASDPQISPDGKQVVYVRNFSEVMADMRYTNLWIVNADGTGHRPLSTGKHHAHTPRWSPDGMRLAYVSSEGDIAQIYLRWMDTGDVATITNVSQAPGSLNWSPDGSKLAFSMLVPEAPLTIGQMPAAPTGAEWAPPAKMTDKLIFRFDGAGEVPPGYTHLFVVSAEGGKPRQITSGNYHHGGFGFLPADYDWAPDGKSLVVAAIRSDDWAYNLRNNDIYEFPLSGGDPVRLTDRNGPDSGVTVSPDGGSIAYTGYDDRYQGYQVTKLYVADRDGGNPRIVSNSLDRSVSSPTWAADGRSIFVQFDSEGVTKLAKFRLNGDYEVLAEGLGTRGTSYSSGQYSLSRNSNYAFTLSTSHVMGEVAVGRSGRDARQVTQLNQDLFSQRELGAVEEIWWESSKDQRRIQGWIIKPPGFDPAKKYPLILEIHGGPFANYGPRFDMEKQLLAAAGNVVLYTNPRGSTSYGEEFGNLIHHAYPGDDFYDLDSSVDAVVERGYIDTNRLYVTGGSGGGVLTAWMIGHSDRFRAAVSFYPVINWESFILTADMSSMGLKYWFPGFPWEHRENFESRSLLNVSKNVSTPTLIMTGEEDWRTPMSESEQYYKALKLQGVEAVLVRVPGESHGIRKRPSHYMSKMTTVLGWFEKHSEDE